MKYIVYCTEYTERLLTEDGEPLFSTPEEYRFVLVKWDNGALGVNASYSDITEANIPRDSLVSKRVDDGDIKFSDIFPIHDMLTEANIPRDSLVFKRVDDGDIKFSDIFPIHDMLTEMEYRVMRMTNMEERENMVIVYYDSESG